MWADAQHDFFASCVFSELRAVHFAHSKFTLGPHHMSKYGRYSICNG